MMTKNISMYQYQGGGRDKNIMQSKIFGAKWGDQANGQH